MSACFGGRADACSDQEMRLNYCPVKRNSVYFHTVCYSVLRGCWLLWVLNLSGFPVINATKMEVFVT